MTNSATDISVLSYLMSALDAAVRFKMAQISVTREQWASQAVSNIAANVHDTRFCRKMYRLEPEWVICVQKGELQHNPVILRCDAAGT